MAIAADTHASAAQTSSLTVTTTGITTPATGATLWVEAIYDFTPGATPITDSKGNTWVKVGANGGNGLGITQRWKAENATGGASHTFTATMGTLGHISIIVLAITGALTSSGLDVNTRQDDVSTPFTAPTATTAQADELLIGTSWANDNFNPNTPAEGTYTIRESITNGSLFYTGSMWTKVVAAIQSNFTPSFTYGEAVADAEVTSTSFKAAASGLPSIPPLRQPVPMRVQPGGFHIGGVFPRVDQPQIVKVPIEAPPFPRQPVPMRPQPGGFKRAFPQPRPAPPPLPPPPDAVGVPPLRQPVPMRVQPGGFHIGGVRPPVTPPVVPIPPVIGIPPIPMPITMRPQPGRFGKHGPPQFRGVLPAADLPLDAVVGSASESASGASGNESLNATDTSASEAASAATANESLAATVGSGNESASGATANEAVAATTASASEAASAATANESLSATVASGNESASGATGDVVQALDATVSSASEAASAVVASVPPEPPAPPRPGFSTAGRWGIRGPRARKWKTLDDRLLEFRQQFEELVAIRPPNAPWKPRPSAPWIPPVDPVRMAPVAAMPATPLPGPRAPKKAENERAARMAIELFQQMLDRES